MIPTTLASGFTSLVFAAGLLLPTLEPRGQQLQPHEALTTSIQRGPSQSGPVQPEPATSSGAAPVDPDASASSAQAAQPVAPVAPAAPRTTSELWLTTPERLLGRTCRLTVQLHSLVEDWNPYLTRFTPAEYVALVGWADEQLPWLRGDYEHPAIVAFLPRGGELEALARGLKKHDRLDIDLRTDELLLGRAWAAITALERLEEFIPEGSILHAIEASTLIRNEAYKMAADELGRALAAPLPAGPRGRLQELLEWCQERIE